MLRALIMTPECKRLTGLGESLERCGFACSFVSYNNGLKESITRQAPDLLLVEMDGNLPNSGTWGLIQRLRQKRHLPVMALIPGDILDSIDGQLDADDFIISPYNIGELNLRAKRLLYKSRSLDSDELIKCDSLVIDLAKCEVTIEGKTIELTFKEYELLKLLASHRGRVYTREALLNKIWGYDYYGGDRTVDVHVRRLRSKIEDSKQNFIETVRNIGYRFRKEL
jgi:two-component system alkaline phosphatase synthesis response regulator PhoP